MKDEAKVERGHGHNTVKAESGCGDDSFRSEDKDVVRLGPVDLGREHTVGDTASALPPNRNRNLNPHPCAHSS